MKQLSVLILAALLVFTFYKFFSYEKPIALVLFPYGNVTFGHYKNLFLFLWVRVKVFVPLGKLVAIVYDIGLLCIFGQVVVRPGVAVEFVDDIKAELFLEVVQLVGAYGKHSAYYLSGVPVHVGGNQVLESKPLHHRLHDKCRGAAGNDILAVLDSHVPGFHVLHYRIPVGLQNLVQVLYLAQELVVSLPCSCLIYKLEPKENLPPPPVDMVPEKAFLMENIVKEPVLGISGEHSLVKIVNFHDDMTPGKDNIITDCIKQLFC